MLYFWSAKLTNESQKRFHSEIDGGIEEAEDEGDVHAQTRAHVLGGNSIDKNFGFKISLKNTLKKVQKFVQSGAAYHSQGFEDNNLGSSPGLLGQ